MKWHRVWALVIRHWYNFKHSGDKMSDAFYWPAMDILLWGLTSTYFLRAGSNVPNLMVILLSGLVYWRVVWRSQYEITTNLLEELWARNMVNFFASPITIWEWMIGVVVLGLLKLLFTLGFAALVVWVLYAVNITAVGWYLLPFLVSLIMMGWWVGFLVAGVIITFGTKIQTIAWAGVAVLGPFSGIYYPVSVLPQWAQVVAKFIPASYVLEGMRSVLVYGKMPLENLIYSFALNLVYLFVCVILFVKLFKLRLVKGLAQLE